VGVLKCRRPTPIDDAYRRRDLRVGDAGGDARGSPDDDDDDDDDDTLGVRVVFVVSTVWVNSTSWYQIYGSRVCSPENAGSDVDVDFCEHLRFWDFGLF